jgi:hypothetical protein
MPDPITLAAVGGTVLVEGIKFLYSQAGEVLKRWRARRDAAKEEAAQPEKPEPVEIKLTPAFEGQLTNPQIHFDAVKRLEGNLREVVKDLSTYASGVDDVDNSNTQLMENVDALRQMLEAIYQQRITFKGEARPPSGTRVEGGIDVNEVYGYAAAVRARTISGGTIIGKAKVGKVAPGGTLIGVDVDQIQGSDSSKGGPDREG